MIDSTEYNVFYRLFDFLTFWPLTISPTARNVEKSKNSNTLIKINKFDLPAIGLKVEKFKISSKVDQFNLPARGRKVEKYNICSKIDYFDLPPRGRKVKKSKKYIYPVKSIIWAPTKRPISRKVEKIQFVLAASKVSSHGYKRVLRRIAQNLLNVCRLLYVEKENSACFSYIFYFFFPKYFTFTLL